MIENDNSISKQLARTSIRETLFSKTVSAFNQVDFSELSGLHPSELKNVSDLYRFDYPRFFFNFFFDLI